MTRLTCSCDFFPLTNQGLTWKFCFVDRTPPEESFLCRALSIFESCTAMGSLGYAPLLHIARVHPTMAGLSGIIVGDDIQQMEYWYPEECGPGAPSSWPAEAVHCASAAALFVEELFNHLLWSCLCFRDPNKMLLVLFASKCSSRHTFRSNFVRTAAAWCLSLASGSASPTRCMIDALVREVLKSHLVCRRVVTPLMEGMSR
jgi:hypothetical protein